MIVLSEAAIRLQGDVIGKPDGPRVLLDAWQRGVVSNTDLRGLLPDAWTRSGNDRPEQVIGTQAWVRMFRAAGFVSQPTYLAVPDRTLRIYRGAPERRSRRMAWSVDPDKAEEHRQRCVRFGEDALVYTAQVEPAAVLALFGSRAEQEVVVDPPFLLAHQIYNPRSN